MTNDELTSDFNPGVYTVKELAMRYFPESTPRSATTQLRRWIVRNGNLVEALHEAGYRSMQRIYTPRQVMIILKYLGEP